MAISIHALIWCIILLLPYIVSTAATDYKVGTIPGVFFTICGIIHMGVFYTNACYLYPRLMNRSYWWLYIPAACLLLFLSFQLKYQVMTRWFPEVARDFAAYKFIFGPSIGIFVISIIYRRVADKMKYEKELERNRAEQLSTELKFLRSQISPHFLFNVLTNLVSLARKQSDQLESSLIRLSDLMRYMLYDTQGKKVALSKEINYLNSYIELQKLRFGSEVEINSSMAVGDVNDYAIEPMLLIPFVENAFKHGTDHLLQPQINIRLSIRNGLLTFEVSNHFAMEEGTKDESSGIGLANVQSRLDLLYKNRHSLLIRNEQNTFYITLTLELE